MASSQDFLSKCSRLKEKGVIFELEQGMIIARGFADLGYEEFSMLSTNKICSLYSGKVSALPDDDKKHFFAVPDADMLCDEIVKVGFDIEGLAFKQQRSWELVTINIKSGEKLTSAGLRIEDAFIEFLLNI